MEMLTVEYAGSILNQDMLTNDLTVVNQMKAEVRGNIAGLESFYPFVNMESVKMISYVKGGTIAAAGELLELKRFLSVFGSANERELIGEYSRVYGFNITDDEILTLQKINDFAEYLLDEAMPEDDNCFRLQKMSGAKIYTAEGSFEITLNRHNFFKPTITIEKNGKEEIYFAKDAASTESILSTWFQ